MVTILDATAAARSVNLDCDMEWDPDSRPKSLELEVSLNIFVPWILPCPGCPEDDAEREEESGRLQVRRLVNVRLRSLRPLCLGFQG